MVGNDDKRGRERRGKECSKLKGRRERKGNKMGNRGTKKEGEREVMKEPKGIRTKKVKQVEG